MEHIKIIEEIAKTGLLRDIIKNIGFTEQKCNLKDLEQDLYVDLLEEPPNNLKELYNNGQLKYYLTRLVLNNIRSKTSQYYYKYKKDENKMVRIKNFNEAEE